MDSQVAVYRSNVRKNKWWFSIFTTGLSIMSVNAWRLWMKVHPSASKMPYLDFLREICVDILTRHREARLQPGPHPALRVSVSVSELRFDRMDHLIIRSTKKGVCQECKIQGYGKKDKNEKQTNYRCEKCNVAVHPHCFKNYHTYSSGEQTTAN